MPKISDPEATAVLYVECQNGLLGHGSVLPAIAAAAAPRIPAMASLAAGARASGVQVVHLTAVPAGGNRSFNRRSPLFASLLDLLVDWTPDHPAVQPIEEIGVGWDDLVLPRSSGLSPMYGTETFKILRNLGIDTLVFAGISVNVAIPVAATEACDEGFEVIIARDAVAGSPADYVEAMLRNTLAMIARLHTVDELLADWGAN